MVSFTRHQLDNGLTLLHHHDYSTRMVAVNLLYRVGSSDEKEPLTGLAHLLEHLMFTGSDHVTSFDQALQKAGGESNAWTSVDATNYYDVLPAHHLETALWLESDRLLSLSLSDNSIATQKSVVIEEFKQRCLNAPYGDLSHLMSSLAYQQHPYRWPAIGRSIDDIAAASAQDIRCFHQRHYAVNNLIMCISGNVTEDIALKMVTKWFGDIPAQTLSPSDHPTEPIQTAPRQMEVERNVPQTVIYQAFHTCGRSDSRYPAADLLSDVLSNGKSARFYQNLILPSNIFSELDAAVSGTLDDGLLFIRAKLRPESSIEEAQTAIRNELDNLQANPVTQYELEKFVNKHISASRFENVGYLQQAMRLCMYEQLGDATLINNEEDLYRNVTLNDMAQAINEVLSPNNCSTVIYKSANNN